MRRILISALCFFSSLVFAQNECGAVFSAPNRIQSIERTGGCFVIKPTQGFNAGAEARTITLTISQLSVFSQFIF
jgi:hypothetical protein